MYDSREVITLGSIHWGDYERINDNIKELSKKNKKKKELSTDPEGPDAVRDHDYAVSPNHITI